MDREYSIFRRSETLGAEAVIFQGFHQDFHIHFHPYYVLGVIDRGRRLVIWESGRGIAGPGSLLLFRPGQPHACRALGEESLHYRSLNLPAALVEPVLGQIAGPSPSLDSLPTLLPHFPQCSAFSALHRLFLTGSDQTAEISAALSVLLAALLSAAVPTPRRKDPPSPQTALILDHLSRHLAQPVRLEDLVRLTGQSQYRLIRSFARETGLTPHRYLLALRVNAAGALLRAGASPLEAALDSGFTDQSHLDRHFKRRMGLTPSQYIHHSSHREAIP